MDAWRTPESNRGGALAERAWLVSTGRGGAHVGAPLMPHEPILFAKQIPRSVTSSPSTDAMLALGEDLRCEAGRSMACDLTGGHMPWEATCIPRSLRR